MKSKIITLSLTAVLFLISCSKQSPANFSTPIQNPGVGTILPDSVGGSSPKGVPVNASIIGVIQPMIAKPVLTLFSPKYYSDVSLNFDGSFKIDSLQDGNYNLLIQSMGGYRDTLITNIPAKQNHTYDLGVLKLLH